MKLAKVFIPLAVAGILYAFSSSAEAITLSPPALMLNSLQAAPATLMYKTADINTKKEVAKRCEHRERHKLNAAEPASGSTHGVHCDD